MTSQRIRLPVLLVAALSLVCAVAAAQQPVRPTGIYCSCPPTNAQSSSFIAAVAQQPFVDGFLVRIGWDLLEPSPGVFDWTLLDAQIASCAQAQKRVALAVVQSTGTPAWLAGLGAGTYTYSFRGASKTVALPWDPVYLSRWTSFVAALGARYGQDTTIALVHATHATHNGFEMHLPFGEEAGYRAAGYTEAVYAQSWTAVLDAFFAAFPNHFVDVDLHPVYGSELVAQQVVAHGLANGAGRFGAFGGWWNVRNATEVYPDMQTLFQSTAAVTFTNVQNVGSWVRTPERYDFDLEVYAAAHELALRTGIRYAEVWNADLLDPGLVGLHTSLADALRCPAWYQAFAGSLPPSSLGLSIRGCPAPGATFEFILDGGDPNAVGGLMLGPQRSDLAIPGIGVLLVGPAAQIATVPMQMDAQGGARLTVTVPLSMPTATIVTQAAAVSGVGIALSAGLELRTP